MKQIVKRNLDLKNTSTEEIEGKRFITGFIPYNTKSQVMNVGYSSRAREQLAPSVFLKTLHDGANVFANFNHDNNKILGSTKSGTLVLTDKGNGLECRCELGNTTWANDCYDLVKNQVVTTLSFEFIPYDWVDNFEEDTVLLRSAKLEAVSFAVPNPAYLETDSFASLRSLFQKRSIDLESIGTVLETGKLDTENPQQMESIKNLSNALTKILEQDKKVEAAKTEQPEDIPVINTKTPEPVIDQEKVKQLEQLQKELLEEIA